MVDREEGESSGHSERWECRKGRLTGRVEMGRVPNRNDYAARSLGSWKAAEVFIVSEESRMRRSPARREIERGLQESPPVMGKTTPKQVCH